MFCRDVAPAKCLETINVINESLNQIVIAHVLFIILSLRFLAEEYVFAAAQAACEF